MAVIVVSNGYLKIMVVFVKYIIVLLVTLFTLWSFLWYVAKPANDFCNGLGDTDNYKTVILKAKSFDYSVYDLRARIGQVKIVSKDSPLLRFTCVISFKNNRIIGKEVRLED